MLLLFRLYLSKDPLHLLFLRYLIDGYIGFGELVVVRPEQRM